MSSIRKRLDDSATHVTLSALGLTLSLCEVPFRVACSEDLWLLVERHMIDSHYQLQQYVLRKPWAILIGTAAVDKDFWQTLISTATMKPNLEVVL
jgi:hypothetical protein